MFPDSWTVSVSVSASATCVDARSANLRLTSRARASFVRRFGKSSHELGQTSGNSSCPDIWELDNGDVAVIGSDLTTSYEGRLPEGVSVDPGERLVIIPRKTVLEAKADIPDA